MQNVHITVTQIYLHIGKISKNDREITYKKLSELMLETFRTRDESCLYENGGNFLTLVYEKEVNPVIQQNFHILITQIFLQI